MQAPQPVQASSLITGVDRPPVASRNLIACASHWSSQTRQKTPFMARQLSWVLARQGQGWSGRSAPVSQASVQAAQKVQAPDDRSRVGNPS